MNKIIKTKVGDEIHYFVNGQENHGVVAKMSATYVTIFKEDGKFYQVPLDDTFFVKDILVNKTWDDMSMEEKTEQLQLVKAYSPRYLSKTWEQLPQELRDVLKKRGAPQDISRLNLGDQKVTPQNIDDETTVYPDLTERKEEGKTQHADAMRRQSEKYREAHPEVKAPDETSQSPIKKEDTLPKPEEKPTKTLPQSPSMQNRVAQAASTVPHPDDESAKDKYAIGGLEQEGGVRGKSPLKNASILKALELLDKIKDKPYPRGMRQTGTPNAPMVNMNVLENLQAQDENRPPSNALPDKTQETYVSQYYGRKKFKTRKERDAFDKQIEASSNYPKKRGRKRQ